MAEITSKTTPPTPTAPPVQTTSPQNGGGQQAVSNNTEPAQEKSPLARRAELMREGKSYAEAQAEIMGGKVSVEELGGGSAAPTKAPETPAGTILSVSRTSGADKYIVRTALPGGGYKQTIQSADQIRAAGGIVPAGDKGYVQLYAGSDLYGEKGGGKLSDVYGFAKELETEQGISETEARRITELAMREPDAPELATIPSNVKTRVAELFGGKKYAVVGLDEKGQPVPGITPQITSVKAIEKLQGLTPGSEEYHDALVSLRLVPKDTPYVDPKFYAKSVEALKPYTTDKGIDVLGALQDKIPVSYLNTVVGSQAVKNAQSALTELDTFAQTILPNMPEGYQKDYKAGLVGMVDLPAGAINLNYDPKTREITYQMPAKPMTMEQAWAAIVADKPELKGATPLSYNPDTGEVEYRLEKEAPELKVLPVGFIGPPAPGEIRAETLWEQTVAANPQLASMRPISFDTATNEFVYEPKETPTGVGEPMVITGKFYDDLKDELWKTITDFPETWNKGSKALGEVIIDAFANFPDNWEQGSEALGRVIVDTFSDLPGTLRKGYERFSDTLVQALTSPRPENTKIIGRAIIDAVSSPKPENTKIIGKAIMDAVKAPRSEASGVLGKAIIEAFSTPRSDSSRVLGQIIIDAMTTPRGDSSRVLGRTIMDALSEPRSENTKIIGRAIIDALTTPRTEASTKGGEAVIKATEEAITKPRTGYSRVAIGAAIIDALSSPRTESSRILGRAIIDALTSPSTESSRILGRTIITALTDPRSESSKVVGKAIIDALSNPRTDSSRVLGKIIIDALSSPRGDSSRILGKVIIDAVSAYPVNWNTSSRNLGQAIADALASPRTESSKILGKAIIDAMTSPRPENTKIIGDAVIQAFTTPHKGEDIRITVPQPVADWLRTPHPAVAAMIPETSVAQLSTQAMQKVDAWLTAEKEKHMEEPEFLDERFRLLSTVPIGAARTLNQLVLGFPGFVQNLVFNPIEAVPETAISMINLAGGTLSKLRTGGYRDMVAKGDADQLVQDAIMTYMIGEMGAQAGGVGIRGAQFVSTISRGDYIPMRGLATEAATLRVLLDKLDKARTAGKITDADILAAGTELNKQLVGGAKTAQVELGGVKIRIKSSEVQAAQGGLSIYSSMPDITLVDRGGSVPVFKDWWGSAKVAIEPLARSYLEGKRATKPGIAELRITDPTIIQELMPQRRLIYGGKILEPEMQLPSLDALQGMGYRLDPIIGKGGKAITYDASLGPVQIRRFTLSKVVDNPTGLQQVRLGGRANTGTVAIGDLHGTGNYKAVFNDINAGFDRPVISGNPNKPSTWKWSGEQQTLVILGDSIDRGANYALWRDTFNRLSDQARATGGKVERLLGNHEVSYLADYAIRGIDATDAFRKQVRSGLLDDINKGYVKAATASGDTLYTHAGVSSRVFPNLKGKTAGYAADYLNQTLMQAVKRNNYSGKTFRIGRVEKGNTGSYNEGQQGGIFWLRPQEATISQLNLGFKQVVGHNPGWSVRRIWGDNFIEVDVSRRTGGKGAYYDTPYLQTEPVPIGVRGLGGTAPKFNDFTLGMLKLKAMRDTVADFVIGWDGRIKAWKGIKENEIAVKSLVKSLEEQIKARKAVGDSTGVKYLRRQINELTSPTGSDYLYGGITFWRDLVMGRQNSVRVLGGIKSAGAPALAGAVGYLNSVRGRLAQFSDADLRTMFDIDRATLDGYLDTAGLRNASADRLRTELPERLQRLIEIVDRGLERNVAPYLDEAVIASRYTSRLQDEFDYYRSAGRTDDRYDYVPEMAVERMRTPERVPSLVRTPTRAPERVPTAISSIRTPEAPRTPRLAIPPRVPTPPRTPAPPRTPTTPVPPRVPTPPQPPRIPPTEEPPKPPPILPHKAGGVGERVRIPEGSIAFAWGKMYRGKGANKRKVPVWRYIPPPWTQSKPETLYAPPIGAKNIDSSNPYTTVQMIGEAGAPVPERIAIDLGITDAFVSGGGQSISFGGSGTKTNVGTNIPSTTQGMVINGGGEAPKGHAYAKPYREPHSVSRSYISKMQAGPERGSGVREIRGKDREDIRERTEKMLEGEEPEPVAVEPTPKPKPEPESETVYIDETEEFNERFDMPWEDGDTESPYDIDRYVAGRTNSKNRLQAKKKKPIRGRGDTPTSVRSMRL